MGFIADGICPFTLMAVDPGYRCRTMFGSICEVTLSVSNSVGRSTYPKEEPVGIIIEVVLDNPTAAGDGHDLEHAPCNHATSLDTIPIGRETEIHQSKGSLQFGPRLREPRAVIQSTLMDVLRTLGSMYFVRSLPAYNLGQYQDTNQRHTSEQTCDSSNLKYSLCNRAK